MRTKGLEKNINRLADVTPLPVCCHARAVCTDDVTANELLHENKVRAANERSIQAKTHLTLATIGHALSDLLKVAKLGEPLHGAETDDAL